MALQQSMSLGSTSSNYWRISHVVVRHEGVDVCVDLYEDHAASLAGALRLSFREFRWSGVDNPCTFALMDAANSNPFKLCYDKLKTLPEFSGAVDV